MAATSASWTLKVKFGDEFRRVRLAEETLTVAAVRDAVAQLFAMSPEKTSRLDFQYSDDEGFVCTLTDAAFPDLLRSCSESHMLRLSAFERDAPVDSIGEEYVTDVSLPIAGSPPQAEQSRPSEALDVAPTLKATDATASTPSSPSVADTQAALEGLRSRALRVGDELRSGVGRLRELRTEMEAGLEGASKQVDALQTDLQEGTQRLREHVSKTREELIGPNTGTRLSTLAALAVGTVAAAKMGKNPLGAAAVVAGVAVVAGSAMADYAATSSAANGTASSEEPAEYSSYVNDYILEGSQPSAPSQDTSLAHEGAQETGDVQDGDSDQLPGIRPDASSQEEGVAEEEGRSEEIQQIRDTDDKVDVDDDDSEWAHVSQEDAAGH